METPNSEQDVNRREVMVTNGVFQELSTVESTVLSTLQGDGKLSNAAEWWHQSQELNRTAASAVTKMHRIENAYSPGFLATTHRLMNQPMSDEADSLATWTRAGNMSGIRGNSVPFSDRSELPQTPRALACVLACMQGYISGLSLRSDKITITLVDHLGAEPYHQLAVAQSKKPRERRPSKYGRRPRSKTVEPGAVETAGAGGGDQPGPADPSGRPEDPGQSTMPI